MKLTLRLPDELGESLKALAKEQGRSLNAQVVFLLTGAPPSHHSDTTETPPAANPDSGQARAFRQKYGK